MQPHLKSVLAGISYLCHLVMLDLFIMGLQRTSYIHICNILTKKTFEFSLKMSGQNQLLLSLTMPFDAFPVMHLKADVVYLHLL